MRPPARKVDASCSSRLGSGWLVEGGRLSFCGEATFSRTRTHRAEGDLKRTTATTVGHLSDKSRRGHWIVGGDEYRLNGLPLMRKKRPSVW